MKAEVFFLYDNDTEKLRAKVYQTYNHANDARQKLIRPRLIYRDDAKEEGKRRYSILRLSGDLEEVP